MQVALGLTIPVNDCSDNNTMQLDNIGNMTSNHVCKLALGDLMYS